MTLEDEYGGKTVIKTVENHLYLGNIISSNGSNQMTINDRIAKGQGAVRDISHILEGTFFGDFYFEALRIMSNSMVISVLTHNIEVLMNLTKTDIKRLEKIYQLLLQKALITSSKVSRCLVLLELGLMSLEFILKQKRIMFLFHLLSSEDNLISREIIKCQIESPKAGDWLVTVQQDLRDIEISLTCEEISTFTKPKFK